jgi:uncharacterized protein
MSHDTSMTLVRSFDVPIERVYAAWTDPELVRRWLLPNSCVARDAKTHARHGERYWIHGVGADGSEYEISGEYLEVLPNRRIVKTWSYEGPAARLPAKPTRVHAEFEKTPAGSGTELTIRHEVPGRPNLIRLRQSWTECLDGLQALLDELPPAGGPNGR